MRRLLLKVNSIVVKLYIVEYEWYCYIKVALEWLEYILVHQVYIKGKSIFLTKSGAFLVMGVFFVCSHVAISAGVLN